MNKRFYRMAMIVCVVSTQVIFAMQRESIIGSDSEKYLKKYQVEIPLKLGKDPKPKIQKDAFISLPSNPADSASGFFGSLASACEVQGLEEMKKAVSIFNALMFYNDKGWHSFQADPSNRYINHELFALVQQQETYFVFFPEQKALQLKWDLGEHEGGWAFHEVIRIQCIANHPRRGTCSDIMLKYSNQQKNIVGEAPLAVLRQVFQKAGKQPKSQNIVISKEDLVAMALQYVSNSDNLKDAGKY